MCIYMYIQICHTCAWSPNIVGNPLLCGVLFKGSAVVCIEATLSLSLRTIYLGFRFCNRLGCSWNILFTFIRKWVPNSQLWARTPPKRLIIVYSLGLSNSELLA